MKNFNWTTFTRKIAINAPLSEIYNAWTKAADLEQWFLSKANFEDQNKNVLSKNLSAEKGARYTWNWYLFDGAEHGTITEANGKDFLQFTFAGDCLVDVQLSMHNDLVIVTLTQKNIPTDDVSKQEIRLVCSTGWSFFLLNLKSVYEGGLDLRNKDEDLKGMINN